MKTKCFKQNKIMLAYGKGKRYGFLGGIHWYQLFDWWHVTIGLTFLFWFVTIEFRWRVFGCGYNHFDKTDIYI